MEKVLNVIYTRVFASSAFKSNNCVEMVQFLVASTSGNDPQMDGTSDVRESIAIR